MGGIDSLRGGAARLLASRRRAALAVAIISIGLIAAGCGGGSGSSVASLGKPKSTNEAAPATGAAPYTSALKYARCMRQHGEPGFPDPNNPGGFSTKALEALDTASHQYISANSICVRLLPNDGQPTPAELQQSITNGLRFAHCMRAHGVPFQDPGISGDDLTLNLSNINTSSPQYLTATKACATKPGA
jgi:hypothetical protein